MRLLVYIDEQLIKISPGTILAYSYQNTFLTDLSTRHVSYTNEISVPFCPENDLIFGYARLEKSNSAKAKVMLSARVVRNGYTLPIHVAYISRTDSEYKLQFYDSFKEFIDLVGDHTIDELNNINPTIVTWDAAEIDARRNSNSDLVSPVVNYGQISRQELINDDFTDGSGLDPWEQHKLIPEGGSGQYQDKQFADAGSYIEAELDSYAVDNGSASFEQPGGTVMFRQKYRFYPGQDYTISLRHNGVGTGASNVYGRVYLLAEDSNIRQLVIDANHTTATTDTVTITPNREYSYVGIFGYLEPPTPTIGGATRSADIRVYFISVALELKMTDVAYFPSVYYKNIFQAIYEKAGYQAEQTSIFSDDIYTNMIMPFSKERFEFTGFFNKCREFEAELNTPVTISSDGNIIFETIKTKDLFGFYNPTTGDYDTDAAYQPVETYDTRSFFSKFYALLDVILISGTVQFQIKSQGFGVMVSQTISTPGRYTIKLTANEYQGDSEGFNMFGGDVVSVYADVTAGSARILSGKWYNKVNGINQLETDPIFYACEILPDMTQKDFLRDMFIHFGIVPFEKNRLLTLKTIEEIISDRSGALDLTSKRDMSQPDEIVYGENYAQNNYFEYPSNDDLFDPTFVRGNIKVTNENLQPEDTLYESPFNGSTDFSLTVDGTSMYMGLIPMNDTAKINYPTPDGEDIDNSPGLRLMIVRDKRASEPTVDYDGNARNDYLVANFTLPDGRALAWEAFLEKFYKRARLAIDMDKPIARSYRLSDADISQVHPHKIIYDSGSYFWLEKIPNHIGEGSVKCNIYKIF